MSGKKGWFRRKKNTSGATPLGQAPEFDDAVL